MNSKKIRLSLILLAVMPLFIYGCKQPQPPAEPIYDTIALNPEPEPESEPEPEIVQPAPKPAPRAAVKQEPQRKYSTSPATEPTAAFGDTSP